MREIPGFEVSIRPTERAPGEHLHEALLGSLARFPGLGRCLIAFSGGADSLALLHAAATLGDVPGSPEVSAVHVHHGLHADADAWADHCRQVCRKLAVPIEVVRVDARARPGESPEAAARAARYAALAARLDERAAVCTAHHQRDQAETLLLQLLRGAGPRGLSAMAPCSRLAAGWLLRPFLDVPPARLADYVQALGLGWIEDPANREARFDRNYLRHEILPRLAARWPAVVATLAGAASLQAEAAEIIAAQAARDLREARGGVPGTLAVSALRALSPARARAVLRAWIEERSLPPPGRARLGSILDAVIAAREDASPLVAWPGAEVRRFRGDVYAGPPLAPADASLSLVWHPPTPLALPYGRLEARSVGGSGLDASRASQARLEVRFRRGGERCRPAGGRHHQALKKLLQASRVPPWLREHVPLVYVDDQLAAVAGLWVCAGFQASGRAPGWELDWVKDDGTPVLARAAEDQA